MSHRSSDPRDDDAETRSDEDAGPERTPRRGEGGRTDGGTARLERLLGVVRGVGRAVVRGTDREGIEREVCERLADAYGIAWIGDPAASSDRIRVRRWVGEAPAFRESLADGGGPDLAEGDGRRPDPAARPWNRAAETGEPQVVDVRDDGAGPWRSAAAEGGIRRLCSVPIRHGGSPYGVLTVCSGRPDAFAGTERTVLAELGETVGHGVDAVESKRAMVADAPVELEFLVSDPSFRPLALARRVDCRVVVDDAVPQPDGTALAYVSTVGVSPAEVRAAVEGAPGVEGFRCIDEGDPNERNRGCLFECLLADSALLSTLLDHGATLRTTVVDETGRSARLVIELGRHATVREFVEAFTRLYPGAELMARRVRDRPTTSAREFRSAVFDRFTDRQREVLTAAYRGGYFESPRLTTAQELADSLEVSQPTVSEHLRAGQRRLFDFLFDDPE